jgi:predicted RNase H-like HicB family nuclease
MPAHKFIGIARSNRGPEYIILTALVTKEGRRWVALCRETGTAAQAATIPDAMRRLTQAIELHLLTLDEVDELYRFLDEQNIQVHKSRPKQASLNIEKFALGALATAIIQRLPDHHARPERQLVTA